MQRQRDQLRLMHLFKMNLKRYRTEAGGAREGDW